MSLHSKHFSTLTVMFLELFLPAVSVHWKWHKIAQHCASLYPDSGLKLAVGAVFTLQQSANCTNQGLIHCFLYCFDIKEQWGKC